MSLFESSSWQWNRRMLGVLRIVVGLLFLTHGTQKLLGFPPSPIMQFPTPVGTQLWNAGLIETIGGVAIILGLLTRVVAFVLAGEMAVAYFTQHFPRGPIPLVNQGELAVLYCFIYLYFVFAGAGAFSIDSLIAHSTKGSPPAPAPERHLHHAA